MTRSRTWWPCSIMGRSSTEPARWSGRAVSCWSGTGMSMARNLASSRTAGGRASSRPRENQSPRSTHVPPALCPSPVRNSSANMSNAVTPLRYS
ncbi:hypothetical protein K5549_013163 [Capra hircus]|nr:hypothetical protein K5549_013163 [Capra hircus]